MAVTELSRGQRSPLNGSRKAHPALVSVAGLPRQGLILLSRSESFSKFKPKAFYRRQGSKYGFLALAPGYLHSNTVLRVIIAYLHGNSLRATIDGDDCVIVQIGINSVTAGQAADRKAGLPGEISVAKDFSASAGANRSLSGSWNAARCAENGARGFFKETRSALR